MINNVVAIFNGIMKVVDGMTKKSTHYPMYLQSRCVSELKSVLMCLDLRGCPISLMPIDSFLYLGAI